MSGDVRVWINGRLLEDITHVRIDGVPVSGSPEWRQERETTPPPDPNPFTPGQVLFEVTAPLGPFGAQRIASLFGTPLRLLGFPSAFDAKYRQRQRNRVKRKRRRR